MTGPSQITPAQRIRLIRTPDALGIIDVRIPKHITADLRLIPGSRHHAQTSFQSGEGHDWPSGHPR